MLQVPVATTTGGECQPFLPPGYTLETDLHGFGQPFADLGATTTKLDRLGLRTPGDLLRYEKPLVKAVQFGSVSLAKVRESLAAAGFRVDDFPCLEKLTRSQIYYGRY